MKKSYADGSEVLDTYDSMNNQSSRMLARGITITYTYNLLTGEVTQVHYSDFTPDFTYEYNHLGQIISIWTQDEEHSYTPLYNDYGVMTGERCYLGNVESNITRVYDSFGRIKNINILMANGFQQNTEQNYNNDGRIVSYKLLANELRGIKEKTFQFHYLPDSHLVSSIDFANDLSLEYTYDPQRNLLTSIKCGGPTEDSVISRRTRVLDSLGRPKHGTRTLQGAIRNDSFFYNKKNELIGATLGEAVFQYGYDNIGNRNQSQEQTIQTDYVSNLLNQYTSIDSSEEPSFIPAYDADGNQIRIRTITGIWDVTYNANNRPVCFSCEDNETVIECRYDHMGRRVTKKVSVSGIVTQYEGYHYLDYVQVAAVDLLANNEVLHTILWNPLESTVTRPLAMVRGNTIYYSTHDFVKNITEWFDENNCMVANFDYAPFGEIFESSGDISLNTIGYSSEIMDHELGLIYYNYRHLNILDGRWISRDSMGENASNNIYGMLENSIYLNIDNLGNIFIDLGLSVIQPSYDEKGNRTPQWYYNGKPQYGKTKRVAEPQQTGEDHVSIHDKKNGSKECYVEVDYAKFLTVVVFSEVLYLPEKYTMEGFAAIIKHEQRRREAHQKAYYAYLEKIQFKGEWVLACGRYRFKSTGGAKGRKEKLLGYISKYREKAISAYANYVNTQSKEITKENKNIIKNPRGEITGISNEHNLPEPPPISNPENCPQQIA